MKEFILLMAFLTSLVALSIDAMLPALGLMADDLHVIARNDIQYVVGFIFLGITIGMMVYGPLSDTTGRRVALFSGLAFFLIGSIISWQAESLTVMLIGRFLQGFGAASPRVITTAIVRDKFEGREMARVMSLILSIFILLPAIAPSIGQFILYFTSWHGIFVFYVFYGLLALVWAYMRLEETLPIERRRKLKLGIIGSGFKEAATNRMTAGYSICSGVIFAIMLGYIHSVEQIFHDIFHVGEMFSIYFAMLAGCLGVSFFVNSALVKRFGMRRITTVALVSASIIALIYLILLAILGQSLLLFMICSGLIFFSIGLTFGNVGTMAMEPMGHIAGLASAFSGAVSTLIALIFGAAIGQMYDGTVWPLALGYLALSAASLVLMVWIERGVPHPRQGA